MTLRPSVRVRPLVVTLALVAALLVLPLALAPRAEAFVYWTNSSTNAIGRANLDGTGVDERFIEGTDLPGAVAVDGRYIYWGGYGQAAHPTEEEGAAIARARLDGTKIDWTFIPNATTGPREGIGQIAVDDDHIYWTQIFGYAGFDPVGSISRANLDGTGVERQFIGGFSEGAIPTGLAVDDNHIYWSQNGGIRPNPTQIPAIGRANLDGTGVERAFIPLPSGTQSAPTAVVVDASHTYWINSRPLFRSPETIGRSNLDGTGIQQSFIGGFTADTNFPIELAVDAGHIYWADAGIGEFTGMIGRASLGGSNVDYGFITPVHRASPGGVAVNFSLGKLKKDKTRGTAKLTVEVPARGGIALAETRKVKGAELRAEAAGEVTLTIKPRGTAKKKLAKHGKVKVGVEVTYTPDGGEPEAQTATLRLINRG